MAFISHTPNMPWMSISSIFKGRTETLEKLVRSFMEFKGTARSRGLDTLSETYLRDIGLTENDLSLSRKFDTFEIARARAGNW